MQGGAIKLNFPSSLRANSYSHGSAREKSYKTDLAEIAKMKTYNLTKY